MVFVGIDNGVTGAIGIIKTISKDSGFFEFHPTPVKTELNYTKAKSHITRIDVQKLKAILMGCIADRNIAYIERPMINPMRWKASVSAIRAMEATQIVLEELKIPYRWIDSREWQKALLPSGLQKEELKQASRDVAKRYFPLIDLGKHDGDALLIAKYAEMSK